MAYCRNCGSQAADQAAICVKCGVPPLSGTAFCQNCGEPTDPGAIACGRCGAALLAVGPPPAYPAPGYPAPGYPAPGYPGPVYPQTPQEPGASSLALVSMILSLVGFMNCATAIPGFVIGLIELRRIKRGESPQAGRAYAMTGAIVGGIMTALGILIIVVYLVFIIVIIATTPDSRGH